MAPNAAADKKDVTIVVNGRETPVPKDELTYDEVLAVAFPNPPTGVDVLITVTYRRGHGEKPEGTLLPGGTLKVKDGMIVNVTATDKS